MKMFVWMAVGTMKYTILAADVALDVNYPADIRKSLMMMCFASENLIVLAPISIMLRAIIVTTNNN